MTRGAWDPTGAGGSKKVDSVKIVSGDLMLEDMRAVCNGASWVLELGRKY